MPLEELNDALEQLGAGLSASLSQTIIAVEAIWKTPLHTFYTDHTLDHSARVLVHLKALANLLPDPLNNTEKRLLAAAAILHDIGMQSDKDCDDLEEVRAKHHEISSDWIVNSLRSELAPRWSSLGLAGMRTYADDIALIAAGHRVRNLSEPNYDDHRIHGSTIRRRLLAAMLRLADALDMDQRRVYVDRLKTQEVPSEARIHWWKCHFVQSIVIGDASTVSVELCVPHNTTPETIQILQAAVQIDILKALEETQRLLPVHLYYDEPTISFSSLVEMMSRDDLLNLWNFTQREWADRADPEPRYFAALHRELEQFPEKLVREAAELPDNEHEQIAQLYKRAGQEYGKLMILHRAADEYARAADNYNKAGSMQAAYDCQIMAGKLRCQRNDFGYGRHFFVQAHGTAEKLQQPELQTAAIVLNNWALSSLGAKPPLLVSVSDSDVAKLNQELQFLHMTARAWSLANAFSWAEAADVLQDALSRLPNDATRERAAFDAAYMFARSGQTPKTLELAEEAFQIAQQNASDDPGHLASAHARYAYLYYVCGQPDQALTEMEAAINWADISGDARARSDYRRSRVHLSWRSTSDAFGSHDFLLQPRRLHPHERAQLDEHRGVEHEREGKLPNALEDYYKSWRGHLQNGEFIGVKQAEHRMAQLLAGIHDQGTEALLRYASLGSLSDMEKFTPALSGITTKMAEQIMASAERMATTVEARVGLSKLIEQLWDRLPDTNIKRYCELLLDWSHGDFHPTPELNLPLQSLQALKMLCQRVDEADAMQVADTLLHDVRQNAFPTVTQARLNCIFRLQLGDRVEQFLEFLETWFENPALQEEALGAMYVLYQQYPDHRETITHSLLTIARQGNTSAANILLQLPDVPVQESDIASTIESYNSVLKRYADHSPDEPIPLINANILSNYAPFWDRKEPGHTMRLLLQASLNQSLMLGCRQASLQAMAELAVSTTDEELEQMWEAVWQLAFGDISPGPGIRSMLDSQHPLSKFKMDFGSIENVKIAARYCLQAFAKNSEPLKRELLKAILQTHFKDDQLATQRNNLRIIAQLAQAGTAADKQATVLLAHWALHHQNDDVVQTMVAVLQYLIGAVSQKDCRALLEALEPVYNKDNSSTRLHVINFFIDIHKQYPTLPDPIEHIAALAVEDDSWLVRQSAIRLHDLISEA